MVSLKKEIDDLNRFREILKVIFEEGFSALISNLNLHRHVPVKARLKKGKERLLPEVRLRKSLERLGPTFIKFGQIMSVRPDLVPKNYIHELEKLQDGVPSFSFNEAKKIIETSTGKKLNEIFSFFEKKPIASASIAQVHKAILLNGEKVAVKVRRPDIEKIVKRDVEIMRFIAKLLEKHVKALKRYRPSEIVNEFASWSERELNLDIESENIRRFYENFRKSKTTKIPRIYQEYCNNDMIVMEFLNGIELHKLEGRKVKGANIRKAMENGFYSILEQVFIHGFFHADPHPSNVFVMADNKVGWIDFGIVGCFDDQLKDMAGDLFIGIIEGDSGKIIDVLMDLRSHDDEIDTMKFRSRLNDVLYPFRASQIKSIRVSKILEDVLDISLDFGIRIPKEFVLFGKSIVTIEGVALTYYPDFRFHEMAQPFIEEIFLHKYEPRNILKDGVKSFFGMKKNIEKIPYQTARVLDKLEKGRIKIEMKDTDIQHLSVGINKSSNRLTYGMIIAALLISGSLTINIGEKIMYGLPIVSLISFIIAGLLGLMLIHSIIKERDVS